MHKRRLSVILAVLAAIILTSGTSYYLGAKSQQPRPEVATAQTVEPEPLLEPATIEIPFSTDAIFELVNTERAMVGFAPLLRDTRLDASALAKCNDLVTRDYWAHEDPDGKMAWHYMTGNNYYYSNAGENLAKDFTSANSTVNGWMNSREHKAIMLDPRYRDTGIAVCGDNNITVQHYANR